MTPLGRRLRRILFLIPYVSKHERGVPLTEIAAILGTSPRELDRELARLTMIGVPDGAPDEFIDVLVEGKGAAARVIVAPRRLLLRPPRLTASEAHALLLGAAALRRSGVPSFDEALARAEAKVRALVRAEGDSAPEPGVTIDAAGLERADHLSTVGRASRERRQVELDYASLAGQKRRKFVVEPYSLLNHRGSWYVLGKSITHAEDRVFAFKVERILGAKMLDRAFTVPRDFDVRDYVGDQLFIAGLRPVPVRLRLRGAAAKRMAGWYRKAKRERGGTVEVQSREIVTGWLAAWVLRQGPEVEVLAPPELARRVRALALRVAESHKTRPDSGERSVAIAAPVNTGG
jgi:predicted DNA-binding transcriptional regulator YafY